MKVENGVDARNSMEVPKPGSGNRIQNSGKLPEQQKSAGIDQNWQIPVFSENDTRFGIIEIIIVAKITGVKIGCMAQV